MAASIFDWSVVAANNGSSDAQINFAEGQAPSTLNNSNRQAMARVAELLGDIGGALTAGGTANALTVTANSAFSTLANGRFLAFRAASDNSAAATLNVNGIGAKSIRKMLSTGDSALSGAEIQADGIYVVQYSEALNAAAGGWLLVNPTLDLSGFVTLTGSQTLTNKLFTTGNAFNGTLGATTPAAVSGTTGAFSGAISGTTGTFSGAVSGTTGTFSGAISGTNGTFTGVVNLANGAQATPVLACAANTDMGIWFPGGTAVAFTVDNADIGRFDANGIQVGKASGSLATAGHTFFGAGASNGLFQSTRDSNIVGQFNVINPVGTETVVEWMTAGTAKGSITINGSTTAYNTTSDRRLKENPRSFDAGAMLDKLKVYQFDWKAGGSGYGVFAQEAVKVFPDAVAKGKRKKMWQVDYSKFVPLLIQEVKNLREEVRRLKG